MNKQLSISNRLNRPNYAVTHPSDHIVVHQGLSISPAEVARMASKGLGVSSSVPESMFYDGDISPEISVPIERMRGIDVAQVWESSQDSKRKFATAQQNDIATYGQ